MSSEQPPDPRPEQRPDGGGGHVRPTPPGVLAAWCVVGLVGGWLLRPLTQRYADSSPVVSWLQVATFWFVAVLLVAVAWSTRRTITRRDYLAPHQAVNRLVLAKASAIVAALAAGGYAGYAVAWIGLSAELAEQRVLRSAVAALGAALMCGAALLLERACRVREDDDAT